MKHFFTFALLLFGLSSNGQMKILFVDDSDDTFLNVESIHRAIEEVGYQALYFNALDSGQLLNSSYLSKFDLVIWQTSNDGTSLSLWNTNDSENEEIKDYLDQGGHLWLGGLDFFFDYFGTPPHQFEEGSFAFDYLGIKSYDCQSYGNDGGLGVPLVIPDENTMISNLVPIKWNFPTLWWVDGVTPRLESQVVYRMSGANYIFDDKVCGVLYEPEKFSVLTCFFDLGVAFDFDLMKASVKPILEYFDLKISNSLETKILNEDIKIYPNPNRTCKIFLEWNDWQNNSFKYRITIKDIHQKSIFIQDAEFTNNFGNNKIEIDLPNHLSPGYYQLTINTGKVAVSKPFVKL